MKKNLKILAITFSVVLNIVFIGSYFYHGPAIPPLAGLQGKHDHPLYEKLNLDHDQLDKFKPIRNRFHTFVDGQGRKIKARQLELIDLLARENPDHKAIDDKRMKIRTLQGQMQAKVIGHILEESKIFTPEQREQFFALIRKRIEKSDGPRPRWMQKTRSNSEKPRP